MRELALFAGVGGGLLGSKLLGWETVCAVEINPFCRAILTQRQKEGHLEKFPIWDDVRTFDGNAYRNRIDIVTGGFPCQDISCAGTSHKRLGLRGARSGLWKEFARIICAAEPRYALIENSPNLRTNGLEEVLQDLASMGYDARWCVLGGEHVGAPHHRERIWILAHPNNRGERVRPQHAKTPMLPTASQVISPWATIDRARVDDGISGRVDRLKATGNAQIPQVVRLAWETLSMGLV